MTDFEKQVDEMLRLAMEQPGVGDAMRAHEILQPAMGAFDEAQRAIAPRWIVSTTSSTTINVK